MAGIIIHDDSAFIGMRKAGKLASQVLDHVAPFVKKGVSTLELDTLCHDFIIQNDAIPAPLNYKGFPNSICTSVNHVVCHGIPSPTKILKEGDILNIDVTVIVDGWHGDTSRMFCIGSVSKRAQKLVDVTFEAMMKAIGIVKDGAYFGDIGYTIQSYVEPLGFSVVRDFCGHGIGLDFHALPQVLHFGKSGTGPQIKKGMFFTIEPMINASHNYETKILSDGWTAVTRDNALSAQWEHTIGVTENGCEIFTL